MATDDLDAPDDERAVELSSIQAIFPELVLDSVSQQAHSAHIDVEVNLLTPLRVIFTAQKYDTSGSKPDRPAEVRPDDAGSSAAPSDTASPAVEPVLGSVVELMHLPSVRCTIGLPEFYPEASPPTIHAKCVTGWISDARLRGLESHAEALWEEAGKGVVLFDYLDWASQAAQSAFGLLDEAGPIVFSRDLETPMLDFDLRAKRLKFERETFGCGVCLEPKKGSACHRMVECGHVFCKACLQDFYGTCITEGDVASVKCMKPGCEKDLLQHIPEKKRRKADLTLKAGELVAMQLDSAMVQRYLRMKRKKELESDKNTVYCPRKWCSGAARSKNPVQEAEDDTDAEAADGGNNGRGTKQIFPADRLSICSDCSFAFCSRCFNGWHGEYVVCMPPRKNEDLTAEEKATEDYLSRYSTRCPTCDSPVQKIMGCNHMLCQLCRTHFCYLCSAYLMPDNPYTHYNTAGQGCYQRLWVLEGGDFEGAPEEFPVREIQPQHEPGEVAAPEDAGGLDPQLLEDIMNGLVVFESDTSSSEEDEVAPPPAPMPPRGRGRGRGRGQGRGGNRGRGAGRGRGGMEARGGRGGQPRAAADPGHERPPLPPHEENALQRFLRLAQQDMEDEWDSDELDSDNDENWAIPIR